MFVRTDVQAPRPLPAVVVEEPRTPENPPPTSSWSGSGLFSRSTTSQRSMSWFRMAASSGAPSFSTTMSREIANRSAAPGTP